jgi:uncharacterized protein YjiS (DUF1127 family)
MTALSRFALFRHASPGRALLRALDMQRSRRSLGALDDRMLRDIGLTRDEARAEADRAAWDVHPTWRR